MFVTPRLGNLQNAFKIHISQPILMKIEYVGPNYEPDGRAGDRDHGVPGGVGQIYKYQPILMKI